MPYHVQFPGFGWEFDINPIAFSIGDYKVYWYGIIIACGLLLAVLYAWKSAPRYKVDGSKLVNCVFAGMITGIIGARLYFCFFKWDYYGQNPIEILYINNGGLAIYGGIIGALLGGLTVAKIQNHPTQTAGSGNHGERSLARHAENVSGPQGAARARVEHFTGRFWYRLLLTHLSEQAAAGQSQNRSQLCLRHADRPCAPCHRARSHHHRQLVWLQSHCGRCGKSRTVRLSFRHGLPLGTRFLFRTPHGGRGLLPLAADPGADQPATAGQLSIAAIPCTSTQSKPPRCGKLARHHLASVIGLQALTPAQPGLSLAVRP